VSLTPESQSPHGVSSLLLEHVVLSIPSGVLALDHDDCVALINPAARAHLDAPESLLPVGAPLSSNALLAPFEAIAAELDRTGQTVSRKEVTIDSAEGGRVLGVTASLLRLGNGVQGKVFLFSDLTRIRELERQAELNQQLAQIGELTAGVVHELRNPLSVISGMAELLQRKLQDDPRMRTNAGLILEEVDNLERLIREFLVFSKPYEIEKGLCEPEYTAARAQKQVERLARDSGVSVSLSIAKGLPRIAADSPKLVQALSNLLRNAIEVSPPGGEVSMEVASEPGCVCFRISDQGSGVDPTLGEGIFNAFVSKKQGGTGLGLSIVHRIVTGHGGTIRYHNADVGGAVFEVRIPG